MLASDIRHFYHYCAEEAADVTTYLQGGACPAAFHMALWRHRRRVSAACFLGREGARIAQADSARTKAGTCVV